MRRSWVVGCILVVGACGDAAVSGDDVDDTGVDSVGADAGADAAAPDASSDAGAGDVSDVAADTTPASPWIAARDYCETVGEMYCDYYLRCERMAVDDVAACRVAFAEGCNGRFEPIYARLEDAGQLRLSREGVARCEAHLETVACVRQLGDLDGGCDGMWQGQVAQGGACGVGIDSLVCDGQTTCVLGLDFCGTCEAAADVGEPCDASTRCRANARCVSGLCAARGLPGDACDEDAPCVIGARCETGACVGYATVAVGASCDQINRCQYKAECVGGICVEAGLLGEACSGAAPCASGGCSGGVCVAASVAPSSCL